MPVDLRPLFAEETEKVSQDRLLTLVTLRPPVGVVADTMYFVDCNTDVVYGGITYVAFPMKLQGISTNTDGSIDKTALSVGHGSPEVMYFVETYNGLSKWRVVIKFVYEKFLDNSPTADDLAYIEEEFLIDTYTATESTITFSLEPIINLNIQLPRRRFMTDSCYWKFGDADTCKFNTATYCYTGTVTATGTILMADNLTWTSDIKTGWVGQEVSLKSTASPSAPVYAVTITESLVGGTQWYLKFNPINGSDALSVGTIVGIYFATCKKTLVDCKIRRNQLNAGLYPGVSGVRRLFL